MHFFEISRTIGAPPAAVWAVLTDARRLESGGFGIRRIAGDIRPGSTIRLWSEAAPGRAFPLKVTAFEPGRRMIWTGGMPLGLFSGVRQFTLAAVPCGTDFRMREDYSGPLLPLIWASIPDLTPSFASFADGLASALAGVRA